MYSAPNIQNGDTNVVVKRSRELSLEEESLLNSKNDHDIPILVAVVNYMRRDFHQNQGFYENTLPRI